MANVAAISSDVDLCERLQHAVRVIEATGIDGKRIWLMAISQISL
jgi:hypothetical protein